MISENHDDKKIFHLKQENEHSIFVLEDESVTLASVLNATLGSIAAEAGPVAAEVSPLPPEWMSIVAGDRPRLQSEPPPPPEPAPHSNYASAAASSSSNSDPATEPPYSNAYIAGMPAKRRKVCLHHYEYLLSPRSLLFYCIHMTYTYAHVF